MSPTGESQDQETTSLVRSKLRVMGQPHGRIGRSDTRVMARMEVALRGRGSRGGESVQPGRRRASEIRRVKGLC